MHMVDGEQVCVVMDEDALTQRQGGFEQGLANALVLFNARAEDLPERQEPGSFLEFDGLMYRVDDWKVNAGLATVALSHPEEN